MKLKPSTPCAAWHTTFGGRCLNCGGSHQPLPQPPLLPPAPNTPLRGDPRPYSHQPLPLPQPLPVHRPVRVRRGKPRLDFVNNRGE